jgi:hypothetical protein
VDGVDEVAVHDYPNNGHGMVGLACARALVVFITSPICIVKLRKQVPLKKRKVLNN